MIENYNEGSISNCFQCNGLSYVIHWRCSGTADDDATFKGSYLLWGIASSVCIILEIVACFVPIIRWI